MQIDFLELLSRQDRYRLRKFAEGKCERCTNRRMPGLMYCKECKEKRSKRYFERDKERRRLKRASQTKATDN